MSKLNHFRSVQLAVRMIEKKVRTSLIGLHTDLSTSHLRALYREIHNGASPTSGLMPEPYGIITTRAAVVEASVLMALYVRYAGASAYRRIEPEALLDAHTLYLHLRKDLGYTDKSIIDITEAWILARELRSRKLELRACRCGCQYVVIEHQKLLPLCPFCGEENEPASLARTGRLSPQAAHLSEDDDRTHKPQNSGPSLSTTNPSRTAY